MSRKDLNIHTYLHRRDLLKFASAGILSAPLYRLFQMTEAVAAPTNPFSLFIYIPAGIEGESWFPKSADLSGSFPFVSKPLEPYRNDLIFFQGFNTVGETNHSGGPKQVFAGGGADGTPLNSIDQILAAEDRGSPFPLVAMGVGSTQSSDGNLVSWRQNQGITTNDNPKLTYQNLFGSSNGGSGANTDNSALLGRKRIIDQVHADFKRLKQALGQDEKMIYESHVTAIDELGQEIDRLIQTGGHSCSGEQFATDLNRLNTEHSYWPLWYHKNENTPIIASLHRKMMVQALSCGLTRVGLLQFGASNTQMPLNFEGIPSQLEQHHTLSHEGGQSFRNVQQAIVQQAASIISELKQIPGRNSSSLLDEGFIYMASCLGDKPNYHNGDNIPCFIAGKSQNRLRTGQMIQENGSPYNQILLTLSHAAGQAQEYIGNKDFRQPIAKALQT
ncbi:MAG: DUF1552 domain-containing protein [Oligoflexus sp.]